jgi:hypothetical protein
MTALARIFRTLRSSNGCGTMKTLSFLVLSLCFSLPAKCQTASCSLQPAEVMMGEPITVTVITHDFNPKHMLSYHWTGTGGGVMGKDATASIDTNNMAPGTYMITAQVTDPKAHHNEASCSASYTVKAPPKNPPALTCTANPSEAMPGLSVTIACNCASPDGIPASVTRWTATSGVISGSGNFASLDTSGAPPGAITVVATCADARGLSTQAATAVILELPPPPPPQATKMSQCEFSSETQPWRVDNVCKATLDDIAQRLIQDPDARLVIVSNASPTEKRPNLAAERAVDCKFYLTQGETRQRIDASRIEARTGSAGTRTAEFWIVPPGATFEAPGTTPVDESKVRPVLNHPVGKRKPQQP